MADTPLPPPDPAETIAHTPGPAERSLGTVRYVGDYELLAELARGGMGVVFRARQVSLNRVVALKMIAAGALADPAAVRRFRFEAEAAANLDHPHVLPVYEVGEHEGHQYYSMKLVAGGSLADRVRANPRPPVRELVRLLSAVCRAVHFAHQRGVLHRDLKPANVLVDADGTPYVADFGLAVAAGESGERTGTGVAVGTPEYMPPEQARGEKGLTVAADVYALGAVLYAVLTGRPPHRGATALDTLRQVLDRDPAPPRALDPNVSADLETVCLRSLAKAPGARYASADELADELDRWLAGEPVRARPPGRWRRLERWARRNPAQLILGLATAFGLALATIARAGERQTSWLVLVVTFGASAAFIAWLVVMVRAAIRDEDARPEAAVPRPTGDAAGAAPPAPLTPLAAARAAAVGGGRGLTLGLAAAAAWWLGSPRTHRPPTPTEAVLTALVGLLGGAVVVLAARATVRSPGSARWNLAVLAAAVAVVLGFQDWGGGRLLLADPRQRFWGLIGPVLPLAAVVLDWSMRENLRAARKRAAAGELSPARVRIGNRLCDDLLVKDAPVVVLLLAAIAGHALAGGLARAFGATPAAMEVAQLGGRLGGVVGGLAAAAVLLRRHAGDSGRYPLGVAGLYGLLAAVLMLMIWWG